VKQTTLDTVIDPEKRAVGRLLRFALVGSVVLAVILLLMLALASANTELFERQYPMLLWLTVGLELALLVLVLELLRRLVVRYRRGLFGTRLMARMAMSFIVMTVVPAALIYLVSVQFIGRSIESWFAVPVERGLESGLTLGRTALDSMLSDLSQKTRGVALELSDSPRADWAELLNARREQLAVSDAMIATGTGRIITTSGSRFAGLVPDLPPPGAMRQARMTRQYAAIEPQGETEQMKMRVIVAIDTAREWPDEHRYLQFVQPVPSALAENAEAVERGRADFQQLSLARESLARIFRITLTLIFLLTVFSAVAAAFLLSGWLTGPLSMLAAGTRAVAEGDYRPVKDYSGRDELGVLTQSFNLMTRQLQDARSMVERNQRELQRANARLESVLANLTAGVLVLDAGFHLTLANAGATRILGQPLERILGAALADLPRLGACAAQIQADFNEQAGAGAASWQRQYVLERAPVAGEAGSDAPAMSTGSEQTLFMRGSILPGRRANYLIVFDDISDMISGQRAVAWAEVARRLAHEIKNPLTPIQLAAERTQRKLADKLPPAEAELLTKNSQTIVNQVAALKRMVDEFRDYSRLPAAQHTALDLDALVDDVLRLYTAGGAHPGLHAQLAPGLPPVLGDQTQLRQVIHNLVKNAVEVTSAAASAGAAGAGAAAGEPAARATTAGTAGTSAMTPDVRVRTEAVVLPDGRRAVRLVVRDNGGGFTPDALARVFEPYVTSKPQGTGLGLAIVKKIIDEHGARIDVANWEDPLSGQVVGAQISILFTKLAESGDNRGLTTTARGGE